MPFLRWVAEVLGAAPSGSLPSHRRLSSDQAWYRRPDVWLVAAVVVLPFGWLLGLCRVAWLAITARRRLRAEVGAGTAVAPAPAPSRPQI